MNESDARIQIDETTRHSTYFQTNCMLEIWRLVHRALRFGELYLLAVYITTLVGLNLHGLHTGRCSMYIWYLSVTVRYLHKNATDVDADEQLIVGTSNMAKRHALFYPDVATGSRDSNSTLSSKCREYAILADRPTPASGPYTVFGLQHEFM